MNDIDRTRILNEAGFYSKGKYQEYQAMNDCQRCGKGTSWTNDSNKLIGGVTVHFCANCLTEFDGFARTLPQWSQLIETDARHDYLTARSVAKDTPEESEFLALHKERDRLIAEIRPLVIEFAKPVTEHVA